MSAIRGRRRRKGDWTAITDVPKRAICTISVLSVVLIALLLPLRAEQLGSTVDTRTLTGKFIVGYQGWFSCPLAHSLGSNHWLSGKEPTIDMLPDVSDLSNADRCDSGLRLFDNTPIYVFSSRNPNVVSLHFRWMRQYGIDGAAIGRFISALRTRQSQENVNAILESAAKAAEAESRVFFVSYDLSGYTPSDLRMLLEDWHHLEETGLTKRSGYAEHRDRPVLELWGLGLKSAGFGPNDALTLISALRSASTPFGGLTIIAGVPSGWRTGDGDAQSDTGWLSVYRNTEIISPWLVGRFADKATADRWRSDHIIPDLAEARKLKLDYMPVVFPGFSWANLMAVRQPRKLSKLNSIPRDCGRFFWRQVTNNVSAGVNMLFGAMFDEVDEGTALFKTLPTAAPITMGKGFLSLDADGCRLPSDWYLRLAGAASQVLHERRLPNSTLPFPIPE